MRQEIPKWRRGYSGYTPEPRIPEIYRPESGNANREYSARDSVRDSVRASLRLRLRVRVRVARVAKQTERQSGYTSAKVREAFALRDY